MVEKIINNVLKQIGENAEKKVENFAYVDNNKCAVKAEYIIAFGFFFAFFALYTRAILESLLPLVFVEILGVFYSIFFGFYVRIKKFVWLAYFYINSIFYLFTLIVYVLSMGVLLKYSKGTLNIILLYIILYLVAFRLSVHRMMKNIKSDKYNIKAKSLKPLNYKPFSLVSVIGVGLIARYADVNVQIIVGVIITFILGLAGTLLIENFYKVIFLKIYYPNLKILN